MPSLEFAPKLRKDLLDNHGCSTLMLAAQSGSAETTLGLKKVLLPPNGKYWDNGKDNGNYYKFGVILGVMKKNMEIL